MPSRPQSTPLVKAKLLMLPILAASAATSLLKSIADGLSSTPKSASPAGAAVAAKASSFGDVLAAKVAKVADRLG